jgi:hypothetical protein
MAMDFNINDLAPYAEGAFQTALIADWDQTKQAVHDPVGYDEQNPIIGKTPSAERVNAYMILAGLGQYGGYKALPDKYKFPYALGSALLESSVVKKNMDKGHNVNTLPILGIGGLLTTALVSDWNKKHKNPVSIGVDKVGSTVVPTFNMQW